MLQLPLYELSEVTSLLDSSILIQLSVPWGTPCPSWPRGNSCPAGRDPQQLQFHSYMSHSSLHSHTALPPRCLQCAAMAGKSLLSIPVLKLAFIRGCLLPQTHFCASLPWQDLSAEGNFLTEAEVNCSRLANSSDFPPGEMLFLCQLNSAYLLCSALLSVPHLAPFVNITSACLSNGSCNLFILCSTRKLTSRKTGSWLPSLLEAVTYASTAWTRFVSLN